MAEKRMTTNLSDRVRWLLAEKNLSQSRLAKIADVKQPSVFGWICGKTQTINFVAALRISQALGVSLKWLAEGVGDPLPAPGEARPGDLVKEYFPGEDQPPAGMIAVPEYRLTLAANTAPGDEPTWEEINDSTPHWMPESFFQKKGVRPEHCRFGRVDGDSMEPRCVTAIKSSGQRRATHERDASGSVTAPFMPWASRATSKSSACAGYRTGSRLSLTIRPTRS